MAQGDGDRVSIKEAVCDDHAVATGGEHSDGAQQELATVIKEHEYAAATRDGAQQELATVIKEHHKQLRKRLLETQQSDSDAVSAWTRSLGEDELGRYAKAMRSLAEEYWTRTDAKGDGCKQGGGQSRLQWCTQMMQEYWMEGGLLRTKEKERRKAHFELTGQILDSAQDRSASAQERTTSTQEQSTSAEDPSTSAQHGTRRRVLDIGSCFNPFHQLTVARALACILLWVYALLWVHALLCVHACACACMRSYMRGVAWRGVAWRGVALRCVALRGVA